MIFFIRRGRGLQDELRIADFVLIRDNWKKLGKKYVKWKNTLESKGLKVNSNKTKAMKVGARSSRKVADDADDPCRLCGKKVTRNSIQC